MSEGAGEPTGPEHILAIRVLMTCRACEGSGLPFGAISGKCKSCGGDGAILANLSLETVAQALDTLEENQ